MLLLSTWTSAARADEKADGGTDAAAVAEAMTAVCKACVEGCRECELACAACKSGRDAEQGVAAKAALEQLQKACQAGSATACKAQQSIEDDPDEYTHVPWLGISTSMFRRMKGAGPGAYLAGTYGSFVEVSIPLTSSAYTYFHFRLGRQATEGDDFAGFLATPVGFSAWRDLKKVRGVHFELAGFLNALQVDHMAGATAAYPTQTTLSLGYGAEGYLGVARRIPCLPFELAFGGAVTWDQRVVTFQSAGIRPGDEKIGHGAFGGRLALELRPLRQVDE